MKVKEIFSRFRNKTLNGTEKESSLHNIHHPDFIGLVEPAFKVGNKQYYRFGKETSIPWGRYMYLQTFLYEQNLRLDAELLQGYCGLMKKAIGGNLKTGIDLTQVYRVINNIESRLELAFEVDTTYRLASCVYFDESEDLYSYNKGYNDSVKIPSWKEARTVDFFYTRPMNELLGLNDSSPADLQTFIQKQTELLKDLAIEPTTETTGP
jgi:hypothetical protein